MTRKEAKKTAAARGFRSVRHWMQENRKAWKGFNSRLNAKGEDRDRLKALMSALDAEFQRFRTLA